MTSQPIIHHLLSLYFDPEVLCNSDEDDPRLKRQLTVPVYADALREALRAATANPKYSWLSELKATGIADYYDIQTEEAAKAFMMTDVFPEIRIFIDDWIV